MMNRSPHDRGQSIAELLVALGIFIVGTVTIGLVALDASVSSRQGGERLEAIFLAHEGLEATRSLRDADFDNLTLGAHGVALAGNHWTFSGTSDTQGQFTRVITITDITIDTKKAVSAVTWQFTGARQNSVTLTEYFTDWNQTHAAGGDLGVDSLGATINTTDIQNIKIENKSSASITIAKIAVWWDNTRTIEEIKINNSVVWSQTGPGTPAGAQGSGTELDISDTALAANSGLIPIDRLRFSGAMSGATIVIKFIMTDTSTNYVVVKP